MKRKRLTILFLVFAALALLGYLQFRTWQRFDWHTFLALTWRVEIPWLLLAVVLIYLTYYLRALRWKLFLKPTCHTDAGRLTPPMFIGFTGLALLGRPGELLRPYLVARRENLTFSSQMGVWAVERIFDIGAFTLIAVPTIFLYDTHLPQHAVHAVRVAGYFLVLLVAGLIVGATLLHKKAGNAGAWVERKLSPFAPRFGRKIHHKVNLFRDGLDTIHDRRTLAQLIGVSLVIWIAILFGYWAVVRSYSPIHVSPAPQTLDIQRWRSEAFGAGKQQHPLDLRSIQFGELPLLTLASMAGSVMQLPAVGGGSQLATIGMLRGVFNIDENLAVSCGIMLWLVTFFAVVPAGLVLAHWERISLRGLTEESEEEEEHEEAEDGSRPAAPGPAAHS